MTTENENTVDEMTVESFEVYRDRALDMQNKAAGIALAWNSAGVRADGTKLLTASQVKTLDALIQVVAALGAVGQSVKAERDVKAGAIAWLKTVLTEENTDKVIDFIVKPLPRVTRAIVRPGLDFLLPDALIQALESLDKPE